MKTRTIASLRTLQSLVKTAVESGIVSGLADWLRDETVEEAIHALQQHDPKALRADLEEVRGALFNLLNVCKHKDAFGETEFYREEMPRAQATAVAAYGHDLTAAGVVPIETVRRLMASGEARELNVLLGFE